jgi:2,4-dienoyl-CoA reductase-like NADH-dependent reductase (Old Yellow Enzyme family)
MTLAACDLLVQPFPDGVTTRRTSVMAGLINGRAVLTTAGRLTEPVWAETRAVALAPVGDSRSLIALARALLADPDMRASLAARAESTYCRLFSLGHSIDTLRGEAAGRAA